MYILHKCIWSKSIFNRRQFCSCRFCLNQFDTSQSSLCRFDKDCISQVSFIWIICSMLLSFGSSVRVSLTQVSFVNVTIIQIASLQSLEKYNILTGLSSAMDGDSGKKDFGVSKIVTITSFGQCLVSDLPEETKQYEI